MLSQFQLMDSENATDFYLRDNNYRIEILRACDTQGISKFVVQATGNLL